MKNNKQQKPKELTTQELEQIGRIKKYRNKHTKIYLTVDEQLTKLKSKNFTIDIDEKLAKTYLSKENYVQFFKPYEDIFIQWTDRTSKNFRIYKNSEIEDVSKTLKSANYKYTKNNKFSDLIKLQDDDLKLRDFLLNRIHKIELIIKNELCSFIGFNIKSETWGNWLLRMSSDYYKSEALNIVYKYKFYKKSIYDGVHNLSLGKLRNLVEIIFESETITPRKKKQLCKNLFMNGLKRIVYFDDKEYEKDLVWKLTFLHNIRNYISHTERFATFLLKERFFRLKHFYKNNNYTIKLVKNTNSDLRLHVLSKGKAQNNLNIEKFNMVTNHPLGYYIEVLNNINNQKSYVESDIFDDFIWWFN